MLPKGRTVAEVVEDAVVRGLRLAGCRVAREDDPEYDDATPLKVDIEEFWVWKETIGLTNMGSYFRAVIRLSGPMEPFNDSSKPIILDVDAGIRAAIIDWSSVRLVFRKGVRKLVDAVASLPVE